jgi:hypothetical protein
VSLVFIVSACEDTTSVRTDDTGDKEGIGDSSFAVFSIDRDSLYFQESGSIRGRGFGGNPDSLKLYVGSLRFGIESVNNTLLEFTVPENALSGKVRLYRGDKLASGNIRITIIPRSPDSATYVTAYGPYEGYENEQVTILGHNLLYRRSDAKLLFGDLEAHIDSFSKYAIFAHVPVGVKDGHIDFYAGGHAFYLGDFKRLEPPGPSIFEGKISSVSLGIHMPLILNLKRSADSINTSSVSLINVDYNFQNLEPTAFQSIGDSLFFTGQSFTGTDTTNVSLRLKLSADEPSVSGMLYYSTIQRPDAHQCVLTVFVFELDSVLYRDKGSEIEMRATQVNSRDQLRLVRFEQSTTYNSSVTQFKLETPFDFTSVIANSTHPSLSIYLVKR